jgi:tRNA G18 (ribose-2'-O)-methylase SpoU
MMKQLAHQQYPFPEKKFPLVVFACYLRTPENIGMLLRTSEAFGVEKIYLHQHSPDPSSRIVKRISRNTSENLSLTIYSDPIAELNELKKVGYTIIALEITDSSIALQHLSLSPDGKYVVVVGEERNGIPQNILNICDESVHLTMFGKNSSLNVVNCLSVALYEITRRLV